MHEKLRNPSDEEGEWEGGDGKEEGECVPSVEVFSCPVGSGGESLRCSPSWRNFNLLREARVRASCLQRERAEAVACKGFGNRGKIKPK